MGISAPFDAGTPAAPLFSETVYTHIYTALLWNILRHTDLTALFMGANNNINERNRNHNVADFVKKSRRGKGADLPAFRQPQGDAHQYLHGDGFAVEPGRPENPAA